MPVFAPSTRFDLHMHSLRSDGRFPPEEVLARCAAGGLDVVAITDHDLALPLPAGPHTFGGRTVTLLAGAEISGMHEGVEYHLLVYFPGEAPEGFRAFCAEQCAARARRYAQARERLSMPDLAPPSEGALRGEMSLTRHHLARQLVEKGHTSNIREAFARYLSDAHGLVPPIELSLFEALSIARAFGGITSWAHPPLWQLDPLLPQLAARGLDAIEAYRPELSSTDRKKYKSAARRHNLALTGGSDWHGWGDEAALGLFRIEAREIEAFLARLQAAPPSGLAAGGPCG